MEARRLGKDSLRGALITRQVEVQVQALDVLCRVALASQEYLTARKLHAQCLPLFTNVHDWDKRIGALECASMLASADGRPEQAVRLLGAAEALREMYAVLRPPIHVRDFDALRCALHETLGKTRFQEAWESGRRSTWQQAFSEIDRVG